MSYAYNPIMLLKRKGVIEKAVTSYGWRVTSDAEKQWRVASGEWQAGKAEEQ
jgi:hypothetical protein